MSLSLADYATSRERSFSKSGFSKTDGVVEGYRLLSKDTKLKAYHHYMNRTKLLETWLASAFQYQPGWRITQQQQVQSFQQFVECITLYWSDTGATTQVYVRVYQGYMSWWTFLAPDLPQREQIALRIATRAGMPVPPVLLVAQMPDMLMVRRVPGEPGRIPNTPAKAAQVADLLARLHAAPVHDEDRARLPDISLAKLLPRLMSWAEEAGILALRQELYAIAERFADVGERSGSFIHGDWHSGNYLSDEQGITAILDWEEAAVGDPRFDVANAAAEIQRSTPELADHFLSQYEAHAGFAVGDPRIWIDLAYLRSRLISALVKHRLAHGQRLPSLNPED